MFYRLLPDKAGDKRFYPPEAALPTHSADGLLRVIRVGLTVYRLLPVSPYKQTSLPCVGMSQMCQTRTCPVDGAVSVRGKLANFTTRRRLSLQARSHADLEKRNNHPRPTSNTPWLAFCPHVGAALRNQLQIWVSIKSRVGRELHPRESIYARIHLLVRYEQHQKGKRPEKGPRGPLHSLRSSLLNA